MPRRSATLRACVLTGLIVLVSTGTARGQDPSPAATAPGNMLSANPFTLMFKWFNADYERRWTSNATWGASGATFSVDDFRYGHADATFKYYPRAAMDGFFIGGRTGVYHVSGVADSVNLLGAGFDIGYNWLLGRRQNVAVSIGAGVTRLFGDALPGSSIAVPTVRLINVGVAF
jgi:hypothetical protein